MIYFDTETCGFHGAMVLVQYAYDDSPILLHNVWKMPINETLELIEEFCEYGEGVCGFNLAFDWFHIQKTYNVLSEMIKTVAADEKPEDHIELYTECEPIARDGVCVKPQTALDLMLFARKGPYQSTMDRKDIRIRRVPRQLAYPLCRELEKRIPIKDIYFAKSKLKDRWRIYPIKDHKTGKEVVDFVDVVLKFAPSSGLKVLAADALNLDADDTLLFHDIEPLGRPLEYGWAPFATAISSAARGWACQKGKKKGYAWPHYIQSHADHWEFDSLARKYAEDDVVYTRGLGHFFDDPPAGDTDSILACMVGSSRWRGLKIDKEALTKLRDSEQKKIAEVPMAPHQTYIYLKEVMNETEIVAIEESTKKVILETIGKWETECPWCVKGWIHERTLLLAKYRKQYVSLSRYSGTYDVKSQRFQCLNCHGTGLIKHPASYRAEEVLNARKARNKLDFSISYSKPIVCIQPRPLLVRYHPECLGVRRSATVKKVLASTHLGFNMTKRYGSASR